ncbi:Lar family restriction alleviation protein [Halorussus ruber]|nr:Lar family restriction alleviation protein [Halorussus ruber]
MSTQSPDLGDCPFCGSEIHNANVLIEYQSEDGTSFWAECPGCGDVVDPE